MGIFGVTNKQQHWELNSGPHPYDSDIHNYLLLYIYAYVATIYQVLTVNQALCYALYLMLFNFTNTL